MVSAHLQVAYLTYTVQFDIETMSEHWGGGVGGELGGKGGCVLKTKTKVVFKFTFYHLFRCTFSY